MKQFMALFTILFVSGLSGISSLARPEDSSRPEPRVEMTAAGSGVNLGITRLLAAAFMAQHQNITLDVPGSIGTKGAIKAVADGAVALGLISRALQEEEKALGIVSHPYARVAIIVGVHSGVPEDTIASRELIEVFKGTRATWKDGNPIIVQAREKNDSGFLVLQEAIPGFREVYAESHQAKRWTLYFNDQDANRALSNTPSAIGVTDLGMISTEHLNIKVLKLDGISPDRENVVTGKYPLSRTLSFIYRPENLSREAKLFLGFVASEAGQGILSANGYIPLP
nr:hypothetical protein [Desulfobacula sp.]